MEFLSPEFYADFCFVYSYVLFQIFYRREFKTMAENQQSGSVCYFLEDLT